MNPEDIFGKDYNIFSEVDPFNLGNLVEGYISRKSNEYYGALIITKVANKEVEPQLIMGTPKMHYPFDTRANGTRKYSFPSAKEIELYEKLDGTNILAFSYVANNYRYISYKTRLRPFASSGRFGNFKDMWLEVALPWLSTIKGVMLDNDCNLSFELYGARNPHVLVYKNSLDIALLFGVTNTGRIIPPTALKNVGLIPIVKQFPTVDKDYVWNYEETRKELQKTLKQEEEGYYSGVEGTVWYLKTLDGRCIQLKCKPELIEAIHFSAGARGGLGRNIILATCWNAYENTDDPTLKFIKELLLEEFKPEIIDANHYQIEKCLEFVKGEQKLRHRVLEEYKKIGGNIAMDKAGVMRALSPVFEKKQMRKVYGIIRDFV